MAGRVLSAQPQHLVQYLSSKPLSGFPTTSRRRKEEEARNSHRIRQKVVYSTLTEGCGLVKNTFQATEHSSTQVR